MQSSANDKPDDETEVAAQDAPNDIDSPMTTDDASKTGEDPEPTDEQKEPPACSLRVSPLAAALDAAINSSRPSAAAVTSNNDAPTSSSAVTATKTKEEPPEDLYPTFGRPARGGVSHSNSFNKFGNSSGGVGGTSSASDPPEQNLLDALQKLDALKNVDREPPSGGSGPSALVTHLSRNNSSSSLLNESEHTDEAVTEVKGDNQTANRVKFADQTFADKHSPSSQQQPQQQPRQTWNDRRISSNPSVVSDTPRYAATTPNQSFLDRKLHQFNYLKKNSALLAIMAGCVFMVIFGVDGDSSGGIDKEQHLLRGSTQTKQKLPERRLNRGVEDLDMSSPARGIMDDSSNASPFIPGGPMQLNVNVDGGSLPGYFSKMMGGGSQQQQQQQAELDAELDMAIQNLGNEAVGQDQPEEGALAIQQMQEKFKEARERLKAEAEAAAEAQAMRQQQEMQAKALVMAQQADLAAAAEASDAAAAQQEQQAAQAEAEQQQPVEAPSDPLMEAARQRAAAEASDAAASQQQEQQAAQAEAEQQQPVETPSDPLIEAARQRAAAESQEIEAAHKRAEAEASDAAAAQQVQQAAQAKAEHQQPVETPSDPLIEAARQRAAAESQEMEAARQRAAAEASDAAAAQQQEQQAAQPKAEQQQTVETPSDPVVEAAHERSAGDSQVMEAAHQGAEEAGHEGGGVDAIEELQNKLADLLNTLEQKQKK